MPKSSTEMLRPRATSWSSACRARSGSAMIALSVTSSLSSPAGRLACTSSRATTSANSGSSRLRIETLTAITTGVPGRLPGGALADRGLQDEPGERTDQAGVLGQRDELVRRDVAPHRVLPPQQRLHAGHAAGARLGLRLVVQLERAVLERPGEVADQGQPARAVGVAVGGVVLDPG